VVQAENALELESGNQTIALQEYELFKEELVTTDQGRSLVLREPQLRQAEARLDAARSKLEEAELELGRTTIRSPFNGLVLEHFIEEGKYIARQGPVARLVATDRFWISLSVPISALSYIDIPGQQGSMGSPVSFIVQADNGSGLERTGHIVKLLGAISTENRMAQLIAAVEDPLDLQGGSRGKFRRLLLGSYVTAEIDCGKLDNVYRIPRNSLREQEAIWLLEDSQLRIVEVDIVWSESDAVLIRGDFDGAELITSRIQNPLPGMKLRSKKGSRAVERAASAPGGGTG
jgi:multidrug efflux pump subunit AcrA (membrane-fusion protein)